MFKKVYYACITSESFDDGLISRGIASNVSENHYSLESLQKEIEEKKWAVGNKWKFKYEDTIFKGGNTVEYKTRHKTLKIKTIEYFCKKEKIIREIEKLSPENGFKEKEPSDKVICLDINFLKNGIGVKTYTVLADGNNYMQRLENYLQERGLQYPENDSITISNIEPYGKEIII